MVTGDAAPLEGAIVMQAGGEPALVTGPDRHHNVIGPGAVRWRSAFYRYQDGNVQFGQRYGSSSFTTTS
ncbi:hypothetical protein WME89_05035 [Sorangium sp. So ce321]|uniref:hypothetical protein n=1 Tax=Sorangium sp. So ce321 TaxID=3133300 RepID=UPI003F63D82B